jgi:EAL domain-containing protein (putative c-di-GMP-specific phosphodiesterase class I)
MIVDVGEWVLRTACRQLKEWDSKRPFFPVSVNLSGTQFRHRYLADMVDSAVRDFQLDPSLLTLEVTESIFINDLDFAYGVLKKLKDIGISISVDDFGTGYSSLSYLKKLPVDNIKIDKSFVKDVATDPDSASIVTSIVSMARSLSLKTIAEGIETEEQWKVLRLLRCDMGQGFYFSPALSPEEMERYS